MTKVKGVIYHYDFNLLLLTVVFAIPNFTKANTYRLPMSKLSNAIKGMQHALLLMIAFGFGQGASPSTTVT